MRNPLPSLRLNRFKFNGKEMIPSAISVIAPTGSGKSVMIKFIMYKLSEFRNGYVYLASAGRSLNFYNTFIPKNNVKTINSEGVLNYASDIKKQMRRADRYNATITFLRDYVCNNYDIVNRGDRHNTKKKYLKILKNLEDHGTFSYLSTLQKSLFSDMLQKGRKVFSQMSVQPKNVMMKILKYDLRIFMIFDDILGSDFLRQRGTPFEQLFTMGRHSYITTIVAVQYLTGLSPVVRNNSKYIIALGNISNAEPFYKHFAKAYFKPVYNRDAERKFYSVYKVVTSNHGALVFNQHGTKNSINDAFYWLKAKLNIRQFHACDPLIWREQMELQKIMTNRMNNRNRRRRRNGNNRKGNNRRIILMSSATKGRHNIPRSKIRNRY